jgi:hypothetical protein
MILIPFMKLFASVEDHTLGWSLKFLTLYTRFVSYFSNSDWEVGQVDLILGPPLKAGAVVGSCE